MRHLPPLNGLRTFEAAARLRIFKLATEELFVTQRAISQQIQGLEAHLGVSFFIRNATGLELTSRVAELLPETAHSLQILGEAPLGCRGRPRAIAVTTSTSFATAWLINRLCLFESANPDITIYINVAPIEGGVNALGRYDIKVSYDIELERSADRHLLLREWLLPVCALDFWLAMVAGETNAKSVLPVTTNLATHRLLLNAPMLVTGDAGLPLVGVTGRRSSNCWAGDVPAFPLGGHFLESDPRMARGATRRFIAWLDEEVRSSATQISGWCGTTRVKINIRSKSKTRHRYLVKYVLRRGLRKHRQHRRPIFKSGPLLR